MSATPVSVIVVSRGRPGLLPRCLTGIGQLCHPTFEIIVVADPAGIAAVEEMGRADRIKLVPFDAANISAARNAGIAVAAGEIVAFIDDDAVPEPTWLDRLAAPFSDNGVSATGGYVIGRNGISFQWTARAVNATGEKIVLDHPGDAPFEPVMPAGFVAKTEGTNCAFRRAALAELGGFDPAFHYFLDETDLNMRIAGAGGRTVIVPLARVHHGYAASERRSGDRTPHDLTEVGASTAVFLRKHAPVSAHDAAYDRLRADQRRALVHHMVDGGLEPRDVKHRLAGLAAGFAQGAQRAIAPLPALSKAARPFMKFERSAHTGTARVFAGRTWNRAALRKSAAAAVAKGDLVTIFRFSPTALAHRVTFHQGGWWEHWGGLFGRSDRDQPFFRWHRFNSRLKKERNRVSKLRQCAEFGTFS